VTFVSTVMVGMVHTSMGRLLCLIFRKRHVTSTIFFHRNLHSGNIVVQDQQFGMLNVAKE